MHNDQFSGTNKNSVRDFLTRTFKVFYSKSAQHSLTVVIWSFRNETLLLLILIYFFDFRSATGNVFEKQIDFSRRTVNYSSRLDRPVFLLL